ncbi:MAG: hypothetical protein KKG94_02975 [Nanoarchaeota archaeon]|nr:hypothetical protein [Nanoarchaeota archaeon]
MGKYNVYGYLDKFFEMEIAFDDAGYTNRAYTNLIRVNVTNSTGNINV